MGFYFFLLGGVGCATWQKERKKEERPNSTRGLSFLAASGERRRHAHALVSLPAKGERRSHPQVSLPSCCSKTSTQTLMQAAYTWIYGTIKSIYMYYTKICRVYMCTPMSYTSPL